MERKGRQCSGCGRHFANTTEETATSGDQTDNEVKPKEAWIGKQTETLEQEIKQESNKKKASKRSATEEESDVSGSDSEEQRTKKTKAADKHKEDYNYSENNKDKKDNKCLGEGQMCCICVEEKTEEEWHILVSEKWSDPGMCTSCTSHLYDMHTKPVGYAEPTMAARSNFMELLEWMKWHNLDD